MTGYASHYRKVALTPWARAALGAAASEIEAQGFEISGSSAKGPWRVVLTRDGVTFDQRTGDLWRGIRAALESFNRTDDEGNEDA